MPKYYTNSKGETIDVSTLEGVHLNNALAKKYRELFESTNKEEFARRLEEVNNLKEEVHTRINKFYEELGDE